MSAGGTNRRVKSENVQQPEEQKPACAAKGEKGMFVQNCMVNVYSDGRVGDIGPVQTNTHTCPLPDLNYDTAFAADVPFFDGIAHLIPLCTHFMLICAFDISFLKLYYYVHCFLKKMNIKQRI